MILYNLSSFEFKNTKLNYPKRLHVRVHSSAIFNVYFILVFLLLTLALHQTKLYLASWQQTLSQLSCVLTLSLVGWLLACLRWIARSLGRKVMEYFKIDSCRRLPAWLTDWLTAPIVFPTDFNSILSAVHAAWLSWALTAAGAAPRRENKNSWIAARNVRPSVVVSRDVNIGFGSRWLARLRARTRTVGKSVRGLIYICNIMPFNSNLACLMNWACHMLADMSKRRVRTFILTILVCLICLRGQLYTYLHVGLS